MKKKSKSKTYVMELTEPQLRLIARALEDWSRLMCGQLDYVLTGMCSEMWIKWSTNNMKKESYETDKKLLRYHMKEIKRILYGLEENASYGIGQEFVSGDGLAYEMYNIIGGFLHRDEKDMMRRSHYEPLKVTKEPLVKITEVKRK